MALIQVRRDTAAAWTSANTTLAIGEIGFETDTNKFKIGNGTAWTALVYSPSWLFATANTFTANQTFTGSITANGITTTGSITANGITTTGTITANGITTTGTITANGNLLTSPKIQNYSETATIPTISSGNLTLNMANGNIFGPVALNANITTLTISNPPANGTAGSITLLLKANGTALSVTWPASILWAGGTAPTLTSTANKTDIFTFITVDGGTSYIGLKAGQNH